MAKTVIGIMGPGEGAGKPETEAAYRLGQLVAGQGWVLLTGGRSAGVMEAAARGAREAGGLTVGVLPGEDLDGASPHLDLAIRTGLGSARNNVNVLSSDAVVACGSGLGTTSEIALALKAGKTVVLLHAAPEAEGLFSRLAPGRLHVADTPARAVEILLKTGL